VSADSFDDAVRADDNLIGVFIGSGGFSGFVVDVDRVVL